MPGFRRVPLLQALNGYQLERDDDDDDDDIALSNNVQEPESPVDPQNALQNTTDR